MQTDQLIPIEVFCTSHQIELSFIRSLHESGLIRITIVEENSFVDTAQLEQLEKIVRLYFEMDINVEGIETIIHLLQKISTMQQQITVLKNRLSLYESN